jgi:hypothetical protein
MWGFMKDGRGYTRLTAEIAAKLRICAPPGSGLAPYTAGEW